MLVSAVMPTRGRKRFAAEALACFLSQTYADKELVILDDADCRSFDVDPGIDGVRYHVSGSSMNIPQKRNAVNSLAAGVLIWHLDSDDWSAPERMAEQAERYFSTGKQLIGYNSLFFHDERDGSIVKYARHNAQNYALGTSLCYTRKFWAAHPFKENKAIASDNEFVREAFAAGEVHSVDAGLLMVARAHSENTGNKRLYAYGHVSKDLKQLPAGFLAVLAAEEQCVPVA